MRVVMMISGLAMAGTERNIVSVAPFIRDEGVDIRLASLNTRRDSALAEEFAQTGIERFDLGAKRMVDPAAWKRFTTMLRDEQIDLIHAEDQDTIVYAALAHRRLGIPTVMTRHVLYEPSDTIKESVRARMVLLAAKLGFNKVVAVSEAAGQEFARKAGLPEDKIVTIYNGLPVDRFKIDEPKSTLRARLGWDEAAPTVIMIAALRRGKGHEVLFTAVPKILESVPKARFMIVGDGEIADQIKAQAAPLGEAVVFLGQRSDIPEPLAASDVLTLPSWAEALPTVLIEAGAASLPVVATDVGGAKEITIDGETGYIIPPGDSEMLAERLIAVLQDTTLGQKMGKAARERVVSTFSLKKQAEETVALYREVIGK